MLLLLLLLLLLMLFIARYPVANLVIGRLFARPRNSENA